MLYIWLNFNVALKASINHSICPVWCLLQWFAKKAPIIAAEFAKKHPERVKIGSFCWNGIFYFHDHLLILLQIDDTDAYAHKCRKKCKYINFGILVWAFFSYLLPHPYGFSFFTNRAFPASHPQRPEVLKNPLGIIVQHTFWDKLEKYIKNRITATYP